MEHFNLVSVFILLTTFCLITTSESKKCSSSEFACDSGDQCIEKTSWCDDDEDCDDSSDESYCKQRSSYFSSLDPNDCEESHFLCGNGVCFPKSAHCDGHKDCEDGSDESGCEITTASPTTEASKDKDLIDLDSDSKIKHKKEDSEDEENNDDSSEEDGDDSSEEDGDDSSEEDKDGDDKKRKTFLNEIDVTSKHRKGEAGSNHLPATNAVEKAKAWLLSIRNKNYGWDTSTARALITLGLTDPEKFLTVDEEVSLMKKQLQLLIAMDMLRNQTTPVPLNRLSLYINAMLATCQDPRNLHGINLVGELRTRTTIIQQQNPRNRAFINPVVYLTLCLVDQTTHGDIYKLLDTLRLRAEEQRWYDMQAISIIAFSCIEQYPQYGNSYVAQLRASINSLLNRMTEGWVGNIYSTALAAQALLATHRHSRWNSQPTIKFLKSSQRENGSFGDVLATYYTLPVLTGKSLLDLKTMPCHVPVKKDGLKPLEHLQNWQGSRHYIRYSLFFGQPLTVSYSIQLQVPVNTSFFDIMRLAAKDDPKFKFLYEKKGDTINVYSIGNTPNDAERGYYWQLHVNLNSRVAEIASSRHHHHQLQSIKSSVDRFLPKTGDHVTFWYRPIGS